MPGMAGQRNGVLDGHGRGVEDQQPVRTTHGYGQQPGLGVVHDPLRIGASRADGTGGRRRGCWRHRRLRGTVRFRLGRAGTNGKYGRQRDRG